MERIIEKTLIILKPDCVARRLMGEVTSRLERTGLRIVGIKMLQMDLKTAELLYSVHKGKPFYERLVKYMIAGPVVVMVIEGDRAIHRMRAIIGSTDPMNAEPGSIRSQFALRTEYNIIHASDSEQSAKNEIAIFFDPKELVRHILPDEDWI